MTEHPPPELAPLLAHLLDSPEDAVARAMALDILRESGRGEADEWWKAPELAAFDLARSVVDWPCRSAAMDMRDWEKLGPAVARWWPIAEVQVHDKKPFTREYNHKAWWYCPGGLRLKSEADIHGCLPDGVFDELKTPQKSERYADYASEEDALADLSRACILWARAQPFKS